MRRKNNYKKKDLPLHEEFRLPATIKFSMATTQNQQINY